LKKTRGVEKKKKGGEKKQREQKEKAVFRWLANIKNELTGVGQLLSVHRPIEKLMTNARDMLATLAHSDWGRGVRSSA
jgi:2-oxoglutarate dehydrogenase complex dehydrogenase (E1) component-like enzyme